MSEQISLVELKPSQSDIITQKEIYQKVSARDKKLEQIGKGIEEIYRESDVLLHEVIEQGEKIDKIEKDVGNVEAAVATAQLDIRDSRGNQAKARKTLLIIIGIIFVFFLVIILIIWLSIKFYL